MGTVIKTLGMIFGLTLSNSVTFYLGYDAGLANN